MTPFLKKKLAALSLTLTTAAATAAVQGPIQAQTVSDHVMDARSWNQTDASFSEGKQDASGVLNQQSLKSIRKLALLLSSDHKWLTKDVLNGLDTMGVHLDEVFAGAPAFIEVDGSLYRILLERVGPGWNGFNPLSSKYLVFINHEVFDGLGENYALGFEEGKERVISLEDIEGVAAIGLTLQKVTPEERPEAKQAIVGVEDPINLGEVRPRFRSPQDGGVEKLSQSRVGALANCTPVTPPSCSFSSSVPVCASASASPFFVLSALKIKTDHEGLFKGNPEVELFPFRLNLASPAGGTSDVRTQWIFSGRTVTDLAGRSVYLPDVQNTNQWYTVSGGLALFPSNLSSGYVATLVENDDTAGKLEVDSNKNNPFKRPNEAYIQIWPFDFFDFLKDAANFIYTLGLLDDSDDLFVESLEINNNLFCSDGSAWSTFPYSFSLSGSEWDMQGYFACIDPTCAPAPPTGGGGGGGCFASGGTQCQ